MRIFWSVTFLCCVGVEDCWYRTCFRFCRSWRNPRQVFVASFDFNVVQRSAICRAWCKYSVLEDGIVADIAIFGTLCANPTRFRGRDGKFCNVTFAPMSLAMVVADTTALPPWVLVFVLVLVT